MMDQSILDPEVPKPPPLLSAGILWDGLSSSFDSELRSRAATKRCVGFRSAIVCMRNTMYMEQGLHWALSVCSGVTMTQKEFGNHKSSLGISTQGRLVIPDRAEAAQIHREIGACVGGCFQPGASCSSLPGLPRTSCKTRRL